MNCPTCNIELTKSMINAIEIDECRECKGIWFEEDEIRQAKDSVDEDLNWMDFEIWKHEDLIKTESKNLSCPKCNKALVAIDYADTAVEVDYCPTCKGAWLEYGELGDIVTALTDELLTKPFSQYIKESLTEAKEIITGPESFSSEWKDFSTVLRMLRYRLFVEKPKLMEKVTFIQENTPIL